MVGTQNIGNKHHPTAPKRNLKRPRTGLVSIKRFLLKYVHVVILRASNEFLNDKNPGTGQLGSRPALRIRFDEDAHYRY